MFPNSRIHLYPGEVAEVSTYCRNEFGMMTMVCTTTLTNHERDGLLEISHMEGDALYLNYFHKLPPTHEDDPEPPITPQPPCS